MSKNKDFKKPSEKKAKKQASPDAQNPGGNVNKQALGPNTDR